MKFYLPNIKGTLNSKNDHLPIEKSMSLNKYSFKNSGYELFMYIRIPFNERGNI